MTGRLEEALGLHQAGELGPAEAIYREVLESEPDHPTALHLLGVVQLQTGRLDEASGLIERALALNPADPDAHNNLGQVYEGQGRLEDAIAAYREAIRLVPSFAAACINLGNALMETGEIGEAAACYQRALAVNPDDAEVLSNLGNALAQQGKTAEAIASHRRAIAIAPGDPTVLFNLANALRDEGKLDQAAEGYQRALQAKPNDPEVLSNLGNVLQAAGRPDDAFAAFERALAIDPGFAVAHYNLGNLLHDRGQLDAAAAAYDRALAITPDDPMAHVNLGLVLQDQGRLDDAVAEFERAIEIDPANAQAENNLGRVLEVVGRLEDALAAFTRACEIKPDFARARSNLLVCAQYQIGITPAKLKKLHAEWDKHHGRPLGPKAATHDNAPDPEKRLRIGLVSPDLRQHPVGTFVQGLLEHHASDSIELTCYSDGEPDALSERLRAASDGWLDTRGMDDEGLSARVRSDGIDILVDLAGHFSDNRLLVFARKPAPIQATWAGYVGTTGLGTIDYLIADPHVVPEDTDRHYTETVIRLPDDYICYTPPDYAPEVGPLPAAGNGFATFGCFNKPDKINDGVLAAWAKIMGAVPGSRMLLKFKHMDSLPIRDRFSSVFSDHGIDPGRIDFEGRSKHEELLECYNRIDLVLDPFPYTGGLSTCEALWMGVPVVTLPTAAFAGRHSLAHLSAAGLPEYVAPDLPRYVRLAQELAGDVSRLETIRAGLRECVARSPLCDGPRFARHFAAEMRRAWQRWCAESDG